MKVYWLILRTILGRSLLLTISWVLLVAITVLVRFYTFEESGRSTINFVVILAPLFCWYLGSLLGSTAGGILYGQALQTVPGYGRRVLSACVFIGLVTWAPIPLFHPWGAATSNILPWSRWAPLWSYGLLGAGFLFGIHKANQADPSRRTRWPVSVLFFSPWIVPWAMVASTSFRLWITHPLLDALPGVNLLSLLCLLVGPLTWSFVAPLRPVDRRQGTGTVAKLNEKAKGGTFVATWTQSRLVALLHRRGRVRLEFLVFPLGLMAPWTLAALSVALSTVGLLWFELVGNPLPSRFPLEVLSFLPLTVFPFWAMTPLYAAFADAPGLSRALLLPGQPTRAQLPHWLMRRQLPLWLGGAACMFLVFGGWALWFGLGPRFLGLFFVLTLWSISTAATWTFWRFPGRSRHRLVDPVSLVAMFLLLPLDALAQPFFFRVFSTWVCLLVMVTAFVIPLTLYRSGLKRWQHMEYGA